MGDTVWRLLLDDPLDGAWNMAVDRAIQLGREAGDSPPTIRIYSWKRPTVTLGRFQEPSGIDWGAVSRWDVDVVRRFTGGRGVLHDDEMTYSIVAGTMDGVPRGTAASYRHLCDGLVHAYRSLGVAAELTERPRGESGNAACYLHSTRADLSVGLSKLAGSAQTWVGSTCLQHGSFTVSRDLQRESEVFHLGEAASKALEETTSTLESLGILPPPAFEFASVLASSIATGLGVRAEPGGLSSCEHDAARDLVEEVTVERPAE